MSGIDKYYNDCIKQAISTLLENENCDPVAHHYGAIRNHSMEVSR